jgi:flagellin
MSQINTNVSALLAQTALSQQNKALSTSLERLSTGLQINSGADNPAGLIASQNLQAQQAGITAALGNSQRADQVMSIADSGLSEINTMLLQLQSLVGQSANTSGMSTAELQANQLQVDSILQTVDRLASTTSFEGTKLLNGTYDYNITNQNAEVASYQINAAQLPFGGTRAVNVQVTTSAQHGSLYLSMGAATLVTGAGKNFQFEVAGATGSQAFAFASGTTTSAMAAAINTYTSLTGVSATVVAASNTYIKLKSTGFGSNQFVSFKMDGATANTGGVDKSLATNENALGAAGGTFAAMTNPVRVTGQDLGATVNGIAATAVGNILSVNNSTLDMSLTMTAAGAQALGTIAAMTISGGGANFSLGPTVSMLNTVSIGIGNVATRNLGNVTDGYLNSLASGNANNVVTGNTTTAQNIINDAISQVSSLRGRIGAFQSNVVGSTIDSLNVALENTTAAESSVTDTDFASETSNLTRSQIMVSAATQVLSIANSQPKNVLTLLQNA